MIAPLRDRLLPVAQVRSLKWELSRAHKRAHFREQDSLPKIVGIVERLGHTLYSGWLADTRPGGMGVSHQASFVDPMRLYVSDIRDTLRTNMQMAGQLPSDRTCTVLQAGFHVSFSNEARYQEFFNTKEGSSFTLNIGGEDVHKINASEFQDTNSRVTPRPLYNYGIRIQRNVTNILKIMPRMGFYVTLKTEPEFANTMRLIDTGKWNSYAEIKHFMNILMTREVQ
jgi:hypothetical protein